VALIGCGAIASAVHLRVLERLGGCTVVAVADPDPRALERARRLAPRAARVTDHTGALEIADAAVIAAPTRLHGELGLAALAAGSHLYLEKPIATELDEGERLVAAARAAGVVAATGFNRRFHPLVPRARELVHDGAIGDVRGATTAFCEPLAGPALPAWKRERGSGGGVLLDLGSHHVDLLRWLLESEVESVRATVRSRSSEADNATLALRFATGAHATSLLSFTAGRADTLELHGDRGTLRIDRYAGRLELRRLRSRSHSTRRAWVAPRVSLASWRVLRLARPAVEPSYARALAAFVEAARGRPRELPTLEDGLRSLEVVLAAERAAAEDAVAGVCS
jgi:predicted dehydrogenase